MTRGYPAQDTAGHYSTPLDMDNCKKITTVQVEAKIIKQKSK